MEEEIIWTPTEEQIAETRLFQWMQQLGFENYEEFFEASVEDISWFWTEAVKALGIEWEEPYKETLNLSDGMEWPHWFTGGRLNVAHNAVYRWAAEQKDAPALIWEGEDGEVRRYTFQELEQEVRQAAAAIKRMGINRGDVVTLYMPMIPETVISMLACSHIGAIFSPVFSGYGAGALATRMDVSDSRLLITADGFYRKGKTVPMKETADAAFAQVENVKKMLVVNRTGKDIIQDDPNFALWKEAVLSEAPDEQMVHAASDEPFMLLYTSGTTGKPKGIVHTQAGFAIKAAFDAGIGMDVKQRDTLCWYTDMGWMMGPFLVYGALYNGAAVVMYEGSPDFPDPGRLWKLAEDHRVTHLGISPTLIRTLMKEGDHWAEQHHPEHLRVLASTGEPWNPGPWKWLYEHVGRSRLPIINYSGGTEISGGILGNVLVKPITPVTFNSPLPGMAADVYDKQGNSIINEVGELVITKPWVGMTKGFWKEPERYEQTYWNDWKDTWTHGDFVKKDMEGYWTITGRSDDTLNIAGKRLGPAEMESALTLHPAVIEAGAIGVPDERKGEAAVCFVVLHEGYDLDTQLKSELKQRCADVLGKSLQPSAIFAVADLPKTRNAKVMRRVIKAAYLQKDPGDLSSLENPQAVELIKSIGE